MMNLNKVKIKLVIKQMKESKLRIRLKRKQCEEKGGFAADGISQETNSHGIVSDFIFVGWQTGTPSTSLITHSPQHPKIHNGKSCISFDFPQLLGGFQEMLLPNSRLLCDAEGMLEKSKRQRIPILHPLFGKVDDAGKKAAKISCMERLWRH